MEFLGRARKIAAVPTPLERLERDALAHAGKSRGRRVWFPILRYTFFPVGDLGFDQERIWQNKSVSYAWYLTIAGAVGTPSMLLPLYKIVRLPLVGRDFSYLWVAMLAVIMIAVLMMGITAFFLRALDARRALKELKTTPVAMDRHTLAGYIGVYLLHQIDELEETLIGTESPHAQNVARLSALRDQSGARVKRYEIRLHGRESEALRLGLAQEVSSRDKAEAALVRLTAFRTDVMAFLAECRDHVARVTGPMEDLALLEETRAAAVDVSEAVALAERETLAAVSVLEDRLSRLRIDVATRTELIGQLVMALPESTHSSDDYDAIERIVAEGMSARPPSGGRTPVLA